MNAVVRTSSREATASVPATTASQVAGTHLIPLADIIVPDDRSRDLDEDWVEALADMIGEAGLINAITVRAGDDDGFRLITGLHRLSAAIVLGWEAIPARISNAVSDDDAKLEEIVENIGKIELTALDRAHHLYDLKQVYERLHPELKRGGDRGNQHTGGKRQNLPFATIHPEIAEQIGLSERAIRLSVAIWRGLSVASRHRCAGTWLAKHQSSLQALSQLTHAVQHNVLELLLADKPAATTVADALVILNDGRLLSHVEKKFASINKTLSGLKDGELEAVLAVNAERIIETLRRMGRI